MERTDPPPPSVEAYLDHRAFLTDWFAWKKQVSRAFSHRAFARRIGQRSPSFVVDVIAGRRRLTPEWAATLADAMDLDAEGARHLGLLVELERAATPEERATLVDQLSTTARFRAARHLEGEGFRYVSDWVCPAVHELARRPDFRADADWIAGVIVPEVPVDRVARALDTLFELGLLVPDGDRVVQAEAAVVTPAEVADVAAYRYHEAMLDLARESLDRFPGSDRHVTGVTFAVSAEGLAEVKRQVHRFAATLLERCEAAPGEADRVLQVHVAAFPLSAPAEEPS